MTEESLKENSHVYEVAVHMKDMWEETRRDMKETSGRLEGKLDANTNLTQQVLLQATKTNGRVNALEDRIDGYPENMNKKIDKISNKLSWMTGIGSAIVFGITIIEAYLRIHG